MTAAAVTALILLSLFGAHDALTYLIPVAVAVAARTQRRFGPRLAVALVHGAARMLARPDRERYAEEWSSHVDAAGGGLRALRTAVSIACLAAPLLAILTRYGAYAPREGDRARRRAA